MGRLLAVALLALCAIQGQAPPKPCVLKPYRVLVVVAGWGDPASQVIGEKDAFQPVAALLKAWSVPFDILRLDQQTLGASYLFDRSGAVRYGAMGRGDVSLPRDVGQRGYDGGAFGSQHGEADCCRQREDYVSRERLH